MSFLYTMCCIVKLRCLLSHLSLTEWYCFSFLYCVWHMHAHTHAHTDSHTHTLNTQLNYHWSQVYLFCPFSCFCVGKVLGADIQYFELWLNYTDGNINYRAWYQKNFNQAPQITLQSVVFGCGTKIKALADSRLHFKAPTGILFILRCYQL